MSEKTTSQVRDVQGAWKKAADEQLARMKLGYAEMARLQEKSLEQSLHAVDELAKLTKDSWSYFGQLTASFWKLSLDATKKAADLTTNQG